MNDFNTVAETIEKTDAASARESSRMVPFAKLNFDRSRNPRKQSAYNPDKIASLARSLHNYGLQDPFVISERADGSLNGIKGHRRAAAVRLLQTEGLPEGRNRKDEPAIPADPSAFKDVKCRVLKGMSMQDELDMLMDHGSVVGLDDQEKYLTAKILTRAGFTHQFIADKIGQSRSNYSNGIAKVLAMPQCVEDAYLSEDDSVKRPPQPVLKALANAYAKDQARPGSRLKEAGPEFTAVWEDFLTNGTEPKPKMIARDKLIDIANTVKDTDILDVIQAIIDNNTAGLSDAIGRIELRFRDRETVTVYSEGIASVR